MPQVDHVLNAGTSVSVCKLLPNRVVPTTTLTVKAAVAVGATTITIAHSDATSAVYLQEGTILNFGGGKLVTLNESKEIPTGAAGAPIKILPATIALVGTETLPNYIPLVRVPGGSKAGFELDTNEVSKRSFEAGIFDDAVKTSVSANIPWEGFFVKQDYSLSKIILPAAISADEIYVELAYPDGLKRSGTCFINGYKEDASLDEIRRVSWTFRLVGEFKMTSPV
jgi:hypothetical protein